MFWIELLKKLLTKLHIIGEAIFRQVELSFFYFLNAENLFSKHILHQLQLRHQLKSTYTRAQMSRWPSGRVLAYCAQGHGLNPWPSHT